MAGKPKAMDMTLVAIMRRKFREEHKFLNHANRTFRSATELGVRTSGYGIKSFPKKVVEMAEPKKERPNPYSNVRQHPYK